jgi:hypothetical protein
MRLINGSSFGGAMSAVVFALALMGCSKQRALLTATSPDPMWSAAIIARSDSVLGTLKAELVIYHRGGEIHRRRLLAGRDAIQDIEMEITGLFFKGNLLVVHTKGTFGPEVLEINFESLTKKNGTAKASSATSPLQ